MEQAVCSDGRTTVVASPLGLFVWDEEAKHAADKPKSSALLTSWPWADICGAIGEDTSKGSSELHIFVCSRGRSGLSSCGGGSSATSPVSKVSAERVHFGSGLNVSVRVAAETIRRLASPSCGSSLLVITNPRSGARKASAFARLLTPIFNAAGFAVSSVTTNHARHMRELGASIVERHLADTASSNLAASATTASSSSADDASMVSSSAASAVAVEVLEDSKLPASASAPPLIVAPGTAPINVVVLGGDGTVTEFLQGVLERCGCGRFTPGTSSSISSSSSPAAAASTDSASELSGSAGSGTGAASSSGSSAAASFAGAAATAAAAISGPPLLAAVLSRLRIAAVPCGTQNALARGLRTPTPLRTALAVVKQSLRPLDALIAVNGGGEVRIGVCGFAWGVPGAIAAGSEGYRWLGTKRYALLKAQHGLSGGLGFRRYEATVTWRDEPALALPDARAAAVAAALASGAATPGSAAVTDDAATAGRGTPSASSSSSSSSSATGPSWAGYKHCRPGCSQCAVAIVGGGDADAAEYLLAGSASSSASTSAASSSSSAADGSRPSVRLQTEDAAASARKASLQAAARVRQQASLRLLEQLLSGSPTGPPAVDALPAISLSLADVADAEADAEAVSSSSSSSSAALHPLAKIAGAATSPTGASTSPTAATPLLRPRGAAAIAASSAASSSAATSSSFAIVAGGAGSASASSSAGASPLAAPSAGPAGSAADSAAGSHGGSIAGRVIAVGFVNTSPDARFSHAGDGRLDVIVARRGGLAASAGLLARYVGRAAGIGDELHSPLLRYAKARSATLIPAPGCEHLPANLDGESWGPGPFAVTLLPCLLTAFGEP